MEPDKTDNFDSIVLLMLLHCKGECCTHHGMTVLSFAIINACLQLGLDPCVYADMIRDNSLTVRDTILKGMIQ